MKSFIAKFLTAAVAVDAFPSEGPPEFAIAGRSNVGKSSLINSLLGQRLAHVSSTPGRTRSLNFIGIYSKPGQNDPELMLVDLPGYGYARISKEISAGWAGFIEPYLRNRSTLRLAIVLVDANIPAQDSDQRLITFLRHASREFLVVATKVDKLSANRLRPALAGLARAHGVEEVLSYSARSGEGRNQLWQAIRSRVGS